jgi:hypothetical protein
MSETVQKHLDEPNSAWHELAATFGGPRRRTIICRMMRSPFVTGTLFYYSRNIASTKHSHTSLQVPSEWKEFGPRGQTVVQSQSQAPTGRGELSWD